MCTCLSKVKTFSLIFTATKHNTGKLKVRQLETVFTMCHESGERFWEPLSVLLPDSEEKIALIQLNTPLDKSVKVFKTLWSRACFKAVVDGAVNELHKYNQTIESKDMLIPDLISGDFDSINPDLLQHYREKEVEVIPTPDQNQTDFTKCLQLVVQKINTENLNVSRIVAYVGFNGRFDHIMANVNTLYKAYEITNIPVYLINEDALACLLSEGKHVLSVNTGYEGSWCGLIPIGCPSEHVTTSGLKWNLNNQPMEFGGIVSTSNCLDDSPQVHVKTDKPLVWTLGIKL